VERSNNIIEMISRLKRLFSKKKESNLINSKKEVLEKFTQYFKSLDENQIDGLRKTMKLLKASKSEIAEHMHEFIDAGLELNELEKAQKIINEYGSAIVEATEKNRKKVEEFGRLPIERQKESLEIKDVYFYALQNKFDINLLPYDKATIKESIELLLKGETDSAAVSSLKTGLLYLDDFVDVTVEP
jgi:hypothetical protein